MLYYYKIDGQKGDTNIKVNICIFYAFFFYLQFNTLPCSETAVSSQNSSKFRDKNLIQFVRRGIAFHHGKHANISYIDLKIMHTNFYFINLAGLEPNDRSQVESKFMNKEIRVIGKAEKQIAVIFKSLHKAM
jgi:hypothetical protein